jgi:type VI secretion system secreted protein VgrG
MVARQNVVLGVAKGLSVYAVGEENWEGSPVEERGLRFHAAHGDVRVEALEDNITLYAEKELLAASVEEELVISAPEHTLFNVQGAQLKLEGENIHFHAPGQVVFRAAQHVFLGPNALEVGISLPESKFNPESSLVILIDQSPMGKQSSWVGMPYKLYANGALKKEDVIDDTGRILVEHDLAVQKYKLELANGEQYDIPVVTKYTNPPQGEAANLGFHKYEDAGANNRYSPREDFLSLFRKIPEDQ